MSDETQESLAGLLSFFIILWPGCWLLFGYAPTFGPLWRMAAMEATLAGIVFAAWSVLYFFILLALEWMFRE